VRLVVRSIITKISSRGKTLMLKTRQLFSWKLSKSMNINIFVPDDYDPQECYPVLYLLHGYGNSYQGFLPNLKLDYLAQRMINEGKIVPLIIVAPNIDNSFGLNSSSSTEMLGDAPQQAFYKGLYRDYLIFEVIPYIERHYSTYTDRSYRFIGGASMGGFAALHAAFHYPELFSKVGGHMPAILLDSSCREFTSWVYPDQEARMERDPIALTSVQGLAGLEVYLDCGEDDSFQFFTGAKLLHKALQAHGYRSQYHQHPGGHDDEYLQQHLQDYLLFYAGSRESALNEKEKRNE
jgi:enterochelin esterase-like enzyme